jgi:glycoside/pentoside/hexuronide:cation symporter, GPH family
MVKAEDFTSEYIPTKIKYAFGIGSAANLALSNLVYGSITYFYNTKMGLSGTLLGIGWLIFGIWNAANDPLFGWLTDNTRSTLGRRIPYLRYGSIFYGILFIICWYPIISPDNQIGLFFNFLIMMIVFDTFFTMLATVYFCLPPEMANSEEQRASISWYGTICQMFAIAIQFIIPAVTLTGALGVNINLYFRPIMIVIGILFSIFIFVSSYYIRENEFVQIQETESFLAGLKKTFKNKSFLSFEVANFSVTMLTWILMTGIFYYIDYVVSFDISYFTQSIWRIIPIVIAIAVIVWVISHELDHIQDISPQKYLIMALAVLTVGFGLLFLLGRTFQLAIWAFLLIGMGYIMGNITISPLMGDVMDYDEIQTGTRREGSYAGVNAIITKPAISIANWAFLGIIDLFGFLRPIVNNGISIEQPQTTKAITGILFSLGVVPMFFTILAIFAMVQYKLHGKEWKEKKVELEKTHIQKEREYMKHLFENEKLGDFDSDLFADLDKSR